jgi:hypothetical protein
MRGVLWRLALILAAILTITPLPLAAKSRSENIAYFVNTPYELNIYKIHGRQPGPTLMIIGGIQGDEPGGLLSADLYADMALEKGNLIVVPRANFNSILQFKRGVNVDMNRRFAGQGKDMRQQMEDQIVTLLKSLIAESDCLLNNHDGSGFYSPDWENSEVNPLRYGQSIIADTDRYYSQRLQQWLELQAMAERVIAKVNPQIPEPRYRFRFNNHRTGEPDTLHSEQRRSATYYALTCQGIPAFGIETSKNLPSTEMKVLHHKLIINAYMEELGIVPETPPVNLEPPQLAYLVIAVNDGLPVVVRDQQTLRLQPGDRMEIVHIEANYQRGLSADLSGLGSLNDVRKPFVINTDTDIVVRKDHLECGLVHLAVDSSYGGTSQILSTPSIQLGFILKINGRQYFYHNEASVRLVLGDCFEVVDVLVPAGVGPKVTVNVKGFMNNPANNTGEDRGFVIDTSKDMLQRHSVDKQGRHYLVIVQADREIGRLHLFLEPPHLRYLAVCIDGQEKRWYQPGDTINLRRQQTLQVMDIQANTPPDERLSLNCSQQRFDLGSSWQEKVLHLTDLVPAASPSGAACSFAWTVKRRELSLGQVFVKVLP